MAMAIPLVLRTRQVWILTVTYSNPCRGLFEIVVAMQLCVAIMPKGSRRYHACRVTGTVGLKQRVGARLGLGVRAGLGLGPVRVRVTASVRVAIGVRVSVSVTATLWLWRGQKTFPGHTMQACSTGCYPRIE